ncbi:hypothetical protein [Thalassobacillus hwangdonensis]|uniref:Tubulin-specific chaperone A n=1 Tax=Thalassobacillus hwangdonensis TaxID=546108 RepID=A0ABW3KYN3_9BACI
MKKPNTDTRKYLKLYKQLKNVIGGYDADTPEEMEKAKAEHNKKYEQIERKLGELKEKKLSEPLRESKQHLEKAIKSIQEFDRSGSEFHGQLTQEHLKAASDALRRTENGS